MKKIIVLGLSILFLLSSCENLEQYGFKNGTGDKVDYTTIVEIEKEVTIEKIVEKEKIEYLPGETIIKEVTKEVEKEIIVEVVIEKVVEKEVPVPGGSIVTMEKRFKSVKIANPNFKRNTDHQLIWYVVWEITIKKDGIVEYTFESTETSGAWVRDGAQLLVGYYSISGDGMLRIGNKSGIFVLANDNGSTGWKLFALLSIPGIGNIPVELTCVP